MAMMDAKKITPTASSVMFYPAYPNCCFLESIFDGKNSHLSVEMMECEAIYGSVPQDQNPWVQLDLGSLKAVDKVNI